MSKAVYEIMNRFKGTDQIATQLADGLRAKKINGELQYSQCQCDCSCESPGDF